MLLSNASICQLSALLSICFVLMLRCVVQAALPSAFYQPGPGIVIESWRQSSAYAINQFSQIPDYPSCPNVVQNANSFQYAVVITNQHIRVRTYFVSSQTGNHKFFLICNNNCQLKIEHLPHSWKTLIDSSRTDDNWSARKWSANINLMKGFRYLVNLFFFGNGYSPDFFRVGVRFPDGTEVKPIDNRFLRISMEFYQWNGLLAQRYNSITFPSDRTAATFYSQNAAKYPSSPDLYTCRSTLYDPYQYVDYGNYYALRYIGYFRPTTIETYSFRMWCNEICEFFLTKGSVETRLGTFSIRSYSNPSSVIMNGGELTNKTLYPIKAFVTEEVGNDYIRVMYKNGSDPYYSSWGGRIRNLLSYETKCTIPRPAVSVINSTALSARLTATYIPPRDNWAQTLTYKIFYHLRSSAETVHTATLNGSLPITFVASNLLKYTEYTFYAYYYGNINNVYEYNLITRKSYKRTDEDVPDIPPPNVRARQMTSTSIKLTWGSFPQITSWNGIGLGYEIKYAVKDQIPKVQSSKLTYGAGNRQNTVSGLLKYTVYEFQIAGRTSKGSGVFSTIVEERTKEDVPSAAPVSVTAQNTSSSSLSIEWQDVVFEHRNGIIIQYNVYIINPSDEESMSKSTVPASQKTLVKSGLDLWTIYSVQVSAETSVGEGPRSSAIQARTDEDRPTGPPQNPRTTPMSAQSIKLDWSNIISSNTNGIITGYDVTCQRTDKRDTMRTFSTTNNTFTIDGLDEYVNYDIAVSGKTQKGLGPYTATLEQRTLEASPSAAPTSLDGRFLSSTAILVQWSAIPSDDENGIIIQYTVAYRKSNTSDEWMIFTVGSANFSFVAVNLNYYQFYEFKVAGSTSAGIGPFSSRIHIRTDADGPSKPPMNLTGHFLDHRSIIVHWKEVPKQFRHGVILGYRLFYRDGTLQSPSWVNITVPNQLNMNETINQTITGLKIFTPYIFKVRAFTYKADGVFSDNVTIWTDDYEPDQPPRNVTGVGSTSTDIVLDWRAMAEIDGDANGRVLGYTVRYQVANCHEDRPVGCNENEVFNITTTDPNSQIVVPHLRKYTEYIMSVQVYNRKGKGNFSAPIRVRTDEDTPDSPPKTVETWPDSFESIKIFWSPIPESLRNGIILGYRVFYGPLEVPLRKYSRSPRSLNPLAQYGALPGEKMIEVNESNYEVEIKGLKDFSWYQIRIGALTSKGLGVTFTINGTCKQNSPLEAPKLFVYDKYGFFEITLSWNRVNFNSSRGEVLGYRVLYWPIQKNDVAVFQPSASILDVLAPTRNLTVKNLAPFARYAFSVMAFTEGGFGVRSKSTPGETCRCPKILYSSRKTLPPIIHGDLNVMGILPKYVEEAVSQCCGSCKNGHGSTTINWQKDISGLPSMKYNQLAFLESVAAGTQINVPFFRNKIDAELGSESSAYAYIPFIPSPGLFIFKRKPTEVELGNLGATILSGSIFQQYSLLLVTTLFVILAGIFFWRLEFRENTDEFSQSFFKGSGTGIWLAYITMTTVGYGDITPRTVLGRTFTVIWTLMGLVLTGMIVGGISDGLFTEILLPSLLGEVDGKILTSNETYLLVTKELKANAVIGNTSDPYFVRDYLLSGSKTKAILDAFKAAEFRNILEHPSIVVESLQKVDASYGVALAGEGQRVRHCVEKYAIENSQRILMELSNYSLSFEIGDNSKLQILDHVMSPHADLTSLFIKYGGISVLILIVLGGIYDFVRWFRGTAKIDAVKAESFRIFEEVNDGIEKMLDQLTENLEKIEKRHSIERANIAKIKMNYVSEMYPHLSLFDHSIYPKRKQTKQELVKKEYIAEEDTTWNDDVDQPIDYKFS